MDWIKNRLGQVIALAALVSTIAGFGYAGAGYVARLEAVEQKSGVSYTPQLKALETADNALTKALRAELDILFKKVDKIEDKQDNSSNPLIQIK